MSTVAMLAAELDRRTRETGAFALVAVRVARFVFTRIPRGRLFLPQAMRIGVRSLPVVLITGTFTGMVLAVQTYTQFKRVELENLLGAVVSISMLREIGPVLTGLVLAGRVGASMAAELGSMKVTEQIDALRALGTDPVEYLVVPRFLACVLLLPVLVAYSDVVGILGGWIVSVRVLGVDSHYYWQYSAQYAETWDILSGMFKAAVFGAILSLICCFKGFNAQGGAEGVGRATTEANVATSIGIIIANFFLAVLLQTLYQTLYGK
ncbi:MAG TPA: ABC transporter permease [Planctomycetota bacterium]|nr:ABC transporter permease [Planctomycetota bacterium]HUW32850.1 ABC transporter permease [Planctomycetota bacterium]